jgi:hypothetical protein
MNTQELIDEFNLISSLDVADGVEQQHWLMVVDSGVFVIPVTKFVFFVLNTFEI